MKHSKRKLTHKDSLRAALYRPQVENLDYRWMSGDTILSGLLSQAMLSTRLQAVNISPGWGGSKHALLER